MKLIEDDGETIHVMPDSSVVLVFAEDQSLCILMERLQEHERVPGHVMLASALAIFLKKKENVDLVLDCLPRKKEQQHRHN